MFRSSLFLMHGRNAGHGWCCVGPCLKSGRGVQVRERRGFHLLIYVTPLNPAPSGQPGQSGNVYCWGVEQPSDILARDLEVRARAPARCCCPATDSCTRNTVSAGTPRSSTVTPRRRPGSRDVCVQLILSTNQLANISVEEG